MSATEAEVMRLTNAERRKAGCGSLTASSQLTQAARGHSRDMVDNGYFSHSGRDGSSAGDRIERVGYRWRTYGENIAQGQTSAQSVMSGWMNSSGHRANILNCSFTQIGVGLSRGSSGGGPMTWTQVFGAPR